jgi:hypothetical protein
MVKIAGKNYRKIDSTSVRNAVTRRPITIGSPTYNKLIKEGWTIDGNDGHKIISPPSGSVKSIKVPIAKKTSTKKVTFDKPKNPYVEKAVIDPYPELTEAFNTPYKRPKSVPKDEDEIEISYEDPYDADQGYVDVDDAEPYYPYEEESEEEPEQKDSDEDIISIYKEDPDFEEEVDIEDDMPNEIADLPIDELNDMLDAIEHRQLQIVSKIADNNGNIDPVEAKEFEEAKHEMDELGLPEILDELAQNSVVIHNDELRHKVEVIQDALEMEDVLDEQLENAVNNEVDVPILEQKDTAIMTAINSLYKTNGLTPAELKTHDLVKAELYINNLVHDKRAAELNEEDMVEYINRISALIKNHQSIITSDNMQPDVYVLNLLDFIRFLKKRVNLIIHGIDFDLLEEMYMNPNKNRDYEDRFSEINSKINNIDDEIKRINEEIKDLHEQKIGKKEKKKDLVTQVVNVYTNEGRVQRLTGDGYVSSSVPNAPDAPSLGAPLAPDFTPLTEEEKAANRARAEAGRQAKQDLLVEKAEQKKGSFIPTLADLTSTLSKLKKVDRMVKEEKSPEEKTYLQSSLQNIRDSMELPEQVEEADIPEYMEGSGLRRRRVNKLRGGNILSQSDFNATNDPDIYGSYESALENLNSMLENDELTENLYDQLVNILNEKYRGIISYRSINQIQGSGLRRKKHRNRMHR